MHVKMMFRDMEREGFFFVRTEEDNKGSRGEKVWGKETFVTKTKLRVFRLGSNENEECFRMFGPVLARVFVF